MIGIHDPLIEGEEEREVLEALRSNWISGGGKKTAAFEESIGAFLGLPHSPVATVNGTSALHLSVRALGVAPGDHVLVSAYGFVATANCVLMAGAEPIFIGPENGDFPVVSKEQVERFFSEYVDSRGNYKPTGRPVRGMLYNEPYGFTCPALAEICELFKSRGLFLVEDASQSLGVMSGEAFLGTLGSMGAFSFNGNKTITTGTGGLLVSKDEQLLKRARKLRHQARSDPFDFFYDECGHNFLMSNVLGAVGLAQARRLPFILERKKEVRRSYAELLQGESLRLAGAHLRDFPAWLNVVLLPVPARSRKVMADLASKVEADGFQIRPGFPAVTAYPMYRGFPCVNGEHLEHFFSRSICLPSGPGISEDQAAEVIHSLVRNCKELQLI
jgi:perosamine synthetase